jgi:Flp pilus assembly protein TadG
MTRFNPNLVRRGVTMVYAVVAMVAILMFVSFAVDLGRVQVAKTELQRAADDVARYAASGLQYGTSTVISRVSTAAADNKVDGASLAIDTTNDLDFGTWDPTTDTFDVLTGTARSSATAIRITARRTTAENGGVPTLFAMALGRQTVDITAVAIATRGHVINPSVAALGCPWLAGMPNGSTVAATGGNPTPAVAPTNSPYLVNGLNVASGVQLSFRQTAGQTGYLNSGSYGPDGQLSWIVSQAPANGINTTSAPIASLVGIFLDNRQPDSYAQAASLDFSTDASRNFQTLSPQIKQVFYIGDGLDDNGNIQVFNVPNGATRLYLGIMDENGWWWDNTGSINCTMMDAKVQMVK